MQYKYVYDKHASLASFAAWTCGLALGHGSVVDRVWTSTTFEVLNGQAVNVQFACQHVVLQLIRDMYQKG